MFGVPASFVDSSTSQTCTAGKIFLLLFYPQPSKLHLNTLLSLRCHSWWIQDEIPYEKDKFRQRIYELSELPTNKCETCEARIFPYQRREPCDMEKHISACKLETCESVRKGKIGKRFFCQDCQNTRHFQCGYCFKKFFSSGSAEHHIETNHSIETPGDCEICHLQHDFMSIPIEKRIRINNRALPKWICYQLRMRRIEKKIQEVSIEEQEEKEEDFANEKIYEVLFPKLSEQTVSTPVGKEEYESYANICKEKVKDLAIDT